MRTRFILFVSGDAPWSTEKRFAFGPYGESKEIGETEYSARRRVRHFDFVKGSDQGEIASAFVGLHVRNLSLDN